MRESWTDERLDYFRAETAQRFEGVGKRFDLIEQRLDRIEGELGDLNRRFDGLQRTMIYAVITMSTVFVAGFAGLAGLIVA